MALVATQGVWMPAPPPLGMAPSLTTTLTIDATGEKVALIGRVWNKDRASKNITKVGFRFGSVTKAGGSALTVSLQDLDTANGPPYQPDGTQDQTVAIANGDAAFASNTWIQTAALSATRAVAFGELLAVVVEYDGAGRLGSDTVTIAGLTVMGTAGQGGQAGAVLYTASWAAQSVLPDVILEFDDGTFGTLDGAWPASATSSITYNSGSAADEVALQFTVPFSCKVDGAWVLLLPATTTADLEVVLYEGTTALATVAVDANAVNNASTARVLSVTFPEVTLTPGTTYYLDVKPTTANNVVFYYFDVAAANHFQAHAGGTSWKYNTRVDGGAWGTATDTRRPYAGIRISALDDGAGAGGGGLLAHPGLRGGFL